MITSIKDGYYPVEDDSIRAKIGKALIRFKEGPAGGTILDMIFNIKHLGELTPDQ